MSLKRKIPHAASPITVCSPEMVSTSSHPFVYHANRQMSSWRVMGDRAVPSSLPLANMTDAVRDLLDPDFSPELDQFSFADEFPRFLKPVSSRIAPEDVAYLLSKGALTLPEPVLRNELLKSYVQWVYSSLPVLDLPSFLGSVARNDPEANISLLLFQAVMFAGTAFVDIGHLQAAGFKTRREARKSFYNNVRLLYAFDYEDDRIAIIQSILLMTYYYEKEETLQKDIWHWAGVCYTQAQSIGLHRDPSTSNMSTRAKQLRIRLWWCLYSRDRLIALALRRPTQINEGICNVPLITLADFDIKPFDSTVNQVLQECSYMGDTYLQRRLAVVFVETVKLCQCLGRVLFAQYTPSNRISGATQETTITLVPRQASDAELQRCSQKLEAWLGNLPEESTCIAPQKSEDLSGGERVLFLHASMLRMFYHATCTALYRPRASSSNVANVLAGPKTSAIAAQKKIHESAAEIADIIQQLRNRGLTPYLPTYGLTVMIPAAVTHLTEFKSSNPVVRDESIWNFRLCVEIISGLRDIYPAADYETECLERAFQLHHGQQHPILRSVRVAQENVGIFDSVENPTFVNATELDLSILRQKHHLSHQVTQSPDWQIQWEGGEGEEGGEEEGEEEEKDDDDEEEEEAESHNQPGPDLDGWTMDIDLARDVNIYQSLSVSDPNIINSDFLQGLSPHTLLNQLNDHMLELEDQSLSTPPMAMAMASRTGETLITGDLERDLGLV